jgi:upstream activation factor subunit UAF30
VDDRRRRAPLAQLRGRPRGSALHRARRHGRALARRLATQLEANTGKPLTPLEEARAFLQVIEATGMNVADLAEFLGRPKSTVAERLALLELGPWLPLIEPASRAVARGEGAAPAAHGAGHVPRARDRHDPKPTTGEKHKGEGRGISLGDFERLVNRSSIAAVDVSAREDEVSYGKQPEFSTSKHDAECGCGGIKFDLGTGSGGSAAAIRPGAEGIASKKPKGAGGGRAAKKAVFAASEEATAKLNAQIGGAVEKFRRSLEHARVAYIVSGRGAVHALPYVLMELAVGAADDWRIFLDVADAHSIQVPDRFEHAVDWFPDLEKWTSKLGADDASALITGILAVRGEKITGPGASREKAAAKLAEQIVARPVPWQAKPKETAPEKIAKKTKAPARAAVADFMKDVWASPALSVIVGSKPQPRTEVTKKLWAYIKGHGLQDKKERRNINSDDALRAVFGKPSVSMFEMTKIIRKHLAGTQAAAALIYTSAKKDKREDKEIPLGNLSADTAELPIDEEDDLWDSGAGDDEDADELEEATG